MAEPNQKPGLTPLKIYSGSVLLTRYINKLVITGSGVATSVDNFNSVTITLTGGASGSSVSASYATSASYASTASFFSGTVFSASYAETASYALKVDGGTF